MTDEVFLPSAPVEVKFQKLEEAMQIAGAIAQWFNSIGFYAEPRRIVGLLVLILMTLRRWGYSWSEIRSGILDLIDTMERYERWVVEKNVYKSDLVG